MQTYNEITNELTGKDLPGKVYENMQSLKSDFSGTEFPTTNLVAGMTVFRTDQNKVYRLLSDLQTWKLESDLNFDGGVTIATQAEAEAGINNVKVMTPKGVDYRLNKDHKYKAFLGFSSIGITNEINVTWQNLADKLPECSVFYSYVESSYANLGVPASGYIKVLRVGNGKHLLIEFQRLYSSEKLIATYHADNGFLGWKQLAAKDEVLPLSGGIMTGNNLYRAGNTNVLALYGGEQQGQNAQLRLYGGDSESNTGYFMLGARDVDGKGATLIGRPDGTLTWGGKDVITAYTIWSHSQYRGKSLGTSLTTAQSDAIRNGTFEDIYVGDYWTIGGVVYRIVALDYYYNCGDTACTTHHVVVVPDTILYSAQMNTSNVVTGGYVGSAMYTSNLASAKTTILNAFGSGHILTIRQYFSNAASSYVTGGTWADANVWLMNEINVYGCSVFANLVHGTNWVAAYTIDNCQYPAFRANPRLIHTRQTYWLRDVATSTYFAFVNSYGHANTYYASYSYGVRPAFCVY